MTKAAPSPTVTVAVECPLPHITSGAAVVIVPSCAFGPTHVNYEVTGPENRAPASIWTQPMDHARFRIPETRSFA